MRLISKRQNKREGGGKRDIKKTVEAIDGREKQKKRMHIHEEHVDQKRKGKNVEVQKRIRHETHEEKKNKKKETERTSTEEDKTLDT